MRNGGRVLRTMSLSSMTLWLPEHFNQFHPRSPEQNQRGKEDKVTILWMDTLFSLYEAALCIKKKGSYVKIQQSHF